MEEKVFVTGYGEVTEMWGFTPNKPHEYINVVKCGDTDYIYICGAIVMDNGGHITIDYNGFDGIHPDQRGEFKDFIIQCVMKKYKIT